MSLEGQISDLESMMNEAMLDDVGNSLPDNPLDLNVGDIADWPSVAEVLAFYPQGLPLSIKNELIALCQDLTKRLGANPNLAVQVVRFPVLGGYTTKEAVSVVKSAPRRKSGLTRDIVGVSLQAKAQKPKTPLHKDAAKVNAVPSTKKLAQLEKQAGALYVTWKKEEPGSPRAIAILQQVKHAWSELQIGLRSRLEYLKKSSGENSRAILGYQKALQKVSAIMNSF